MKQKLRKWSTLRNQILLVFVIVMAIVLFVVGGMTYNAVSTLLKNNAERQIQQTAVQASGRMDELYQHIDRLTNQVATDPSVQQLLLEEELGQPATFNQRQALMNIVNNYQAYSNGIDLFELYLHDGQRVFPLNEANLIGRIEEESIRQAEEAKGRLVWIGRDRLNPNIFLALRQVNLIDRWFSPGGYLVVQIRSDYFQFQESDEVEDFMILVDEHDKMIASTYQGDIERMVTHDQESVMIDETEYMLVKEDSRLTGWQTFILMPIAAVTEDVVFLQTTLMYSAGIGFLIFLFFSYGLSNLVTRPIQKLTKIMHYGKLGALKPNPETYSTVELNELNETYNDMVTTMNHLIEVVYEKELIRSQSELKALQAQINPHFLFNTLEALYWSLDEKGEDELAEYVIAMSELFRYTISHPMDDGWVYLKEEVDHIERYMHIMKIRFGDRLTWKINVPIEYEAVKIPKLLIQPLVENAILHGVGNKNGQGEVSVRVGQSENPETLLVEVVDDGPGMDKTSIETVMKLIKNDRIPSVKGNGIAMVNVNKRLELFYNGETVKGITIESEVGKGTRVFFEIPSEGGS
ncbi:sensor histidine kinase [Halalkalibacter kiskunsagensis]|uniref:Sensor histidine kinase n=1 Tax=Halalkalibacter kiskunsagensis TaxID=1548599 RepID=A0ABV6K9G4_9BACI